MARLGISLYPEHSTLEKDKAYVTLAAKYGFKRIFTCLLSVDKEREEILAEFRELIDHAHSYGMEVILDVAPFVFEKLHVSYDDLSFFAEMHADGIRLDEGFDSLKEALMTYNPQNLKIEINASLGTKYLDNIMSHYPKLENIITCHNFYPQRYSGISYEHFEKCSQDIKDLNIKVAAFVSSQEEGTYGPWKYTVTCQSMCRQDICLPQDWWMMSSSQMLMRVRKSSLRFQKLIPVSLPLRLILKRIFTRQKKRSFTSTRILFVEI